MTRSRWWVRERESARGSAVCLARAHARACERERKSPTWSRQHFRPIKICRSHRKLPQTQLIATGTIDILLQQFMALIWACKAQAIILLMLFVYLSRDEPDEVRWACDHRQNSLALVPSVCARKWQREWYKIFSWGSHKLYYSLRNPCFQLLFKSTGLGLTFVFWVNARFRSNIIPTKVGRVLGHVTLYIWLFVTDEWRIETRTDCHGLLCFLELDLPLMTSHDPNSLGSRIVTTQCANIWQDFWPLDTMWRYILMISYLKNSHL